MDPPRMSILTIWAKLNPAFTGYLRLSSDKFSKTLLPLSSAKSFWSAVEMFRAPVRMTQIGEYLPS